MSLYEDWNQLIESQASTPQQAQMFWDAYFAEETRCYEKILGEKQNKIAGVYSDVAKSFEMENVVFVGFLDGINTSLEKEVELESLEETTELDLTIDFEKLFFNMLEAKAKWLYTLKQWDGILSEERRKEIQKEWRASKQAVSEKTVGRNDPCPCGSGKKYKKCCGKHVE